MKHVQYEKALVKSDNYPNGLDVYWFYVQKRLDGVLCWVWDGDSLSYPDAVRKYPPSRFIWDEIPED